MIRSIRVGGALALAATLLVASACASKRHGARPRGLADPALARQMYEDALRDLERRNLRRARTNLEKIQFPASERLKLEPLVKLAAADAMFYQGDDLSLIEARAKYQDFVLVYPNHPRAPYAQFQAGMCSLKQVRDATRDQTQTLAAIADLQEVGKRFPGSAYARAASDALAEAEANLAEHEYAVGRFYAQRRRWAAAADRFKALLEKYPRYGEKEKVYFQLGRTLMEGASRAEGRIWLDKVVKDYPRSRWADDAKKLLAEDAARTKPRSEGKERAS